VSRGRKAAKPPALGFGFVPGAQPHHFLVTIPKAAKDDHVYVSEHLEWDDSEARRELHLALGKEDSKIRVMLPKAKWQAIADEVRADFNRRLAEQGLPAGRWATGQVPVSRLLGKELVLLAWAIEDADPSLTPTAVRNWRGLAPEERWWLFTMTNAATGHAVTGRNRGWRKAVRFALTENPVSDDGFEYRRSQPELSLFRDLVAASAGDGALKASDS
jgi:hypothetical protein